MLFGTAWCSRPVGAGTVVLCVFLSIRRWWVASGVQSVADQQHATDKATMSALKSPVVGNKAFAAVRDIITCRASPGGNVPVPRLQGKRTGLSVYKLPDVVDTCGPAIARCSRRCAWHCEPSPSQVGVRVVAAVRRLGLNAILTALLPPSALDRRRQTALAGCGPISGKT